MTKILPFVKLLVIALLVITSSNKTFADAAVISAGTAVALLADDPDDTNTGCSSEVIMTGYKTHGDTLYMNLQNRSHKLIRNMLFNIEYHKGGSESKTKLYKAEGINIMPDSIMKVKIVDTVVRNSKQINFMLYNYDSKTQYEKRQENILDIVFGIILMSMLAIYGLILYKKSNEK